MTTEETQSRQGTMEQPVPMTFGTPQNVDTQQTQGNPIQSSVMKKEAKQASDELKRLSQEYQRRGLENIDTATVMYHVNTLRYANIKLSKSHEELYRACESSWTNPGNSNQDNPSSGNVPGIREAGSW